MDMGFEKQCREIVSMMLQKKSAQRRREAMDRANALATDSNGNSSSSSNNDYNDYNDDDDDGSGGSIVQQVLVSATVDSKLQALVEDIGATRRGGVGDDDEDDDDEDEAKRNGISFIGSGGNFAMIDVNAALKRQREKEGDGKEGGGGGGGGEGRDASSASSSQFARTALNLATPEQLQQHFVVTPARLRLVTLVAFLAHELEAIGGGARVIVFMSTCASVDFHYELLTRAAKLAGRGSPLKGLLGSLFRLHGSIPHSERQASFKAFCSDSDEENKVLVCTDVAARGLDLPQVDWIVQVSEITLSLSLSLSLCVCMCVSV